MKIVIFKNLRDHKTGLPLMMETSDKNQTRGFPITGRPLQEGETVRTIARKSSGRLRKALENSDPFTLI